MQKESLARGCGAFDYPARDRSVRSIRSQSALKGGSLGRLLGFVRHRLKLVILFLIFVLDLRLFFFGLFLSKVRIIFRAQAGLLPWIIHLITPWLNDLEPDRKPTLLRRFRAGEKASRRESFSSKEDN